MDDSNKLINLGYLNIAIKLMAYICLIPIIPAAIEVSNNADFITLLYPVIYGLVSFIFLLALNGAISCIIDIRYHQINSLKKEKVN